MSPIMYETFVQINLLNGV